jgi:hypothetical protein
MSFDYITNPNQGLGDCLSCFNTDKPIWSPSPHFQILRKYTTIPTLDMPEGIGLSVCDVIANEHLFNSVRQASGLEHLKEPKAILDLIKHEPIDNNVAFSFDVGAHAMNQLHMHPQARQLYDFHHETIQEFISKNKDYNFIEVGNKSFGFKDVTQRTNVGLDYTIEILRKCKYYFGMHSGMMHLATAIGLKSTIIINFPTIAKLLDPICTIENDKIWLYPQHNYLHEDEIYGKFCITVRNLEAKVFGQ